MMPNLSVAASDKVTVLPYQSEVRMPRMNVLTAEQKKFLHSKLNVQKVFGVDIS